MKQVCEMTNAEQAVYFMEYGQKQELMTANTVYVTIETYASVCDLYTRLHFHNKKRGDFDKFFETYKVETLKKLLEAVL